MIELKTLNDVSLIKELKKLHDYDLASLIDESSLDEKIRILGLISLEKKKMILPYVQKINEVIKLFSINQICYFLKKLNSPDSSRIFSALTFKQKYQVLKKLPSQKLKVINQILMYDENSVGRIMNEFFINVECDFLVQDAMRILITNAPYTSCLNTIFVTKDKELVGTIELNKLIIARKEDQIKDIMDTDFVSLDVTSDVSKLSDVYDSYGSQDIPVLENKCLVGVITVDDLFEIITDESEEDIAKFGGINELNKTHDSIFKQANSRLPWLIILLFLDFLVAILIANFSGLISKIPSLVLFQTAILGLAGNSSTQSLAVMVKNLTYNKFSKKRSFLVYLCKEILSGLFIASILGVLCVLFVFISLTINQVGENVFKLAITVGISTFLSVFLANLFGILIPYFFFKIKVDPANASGPFITTINDIVTLLIYFLIACIFFL